jgi:hypothetical protein
MEAIAFIGGDRAMVFWDRDVAPYLDTEDLDNAQCEIWNASEAHGVASVRLMPGGSFHNEVDRHFDWLPNENRWRRYPEEPCGSRHGD